MHWERFRERKGLIQCTKYGPFPLTAGEKSSGGDSFLGADCHACGFFLGYVLAHPQALFIAVVHKYLHLNK